MGATQCGLTWHGSHGALLLPLVHCNTWWGHDSAPPHAPALPTHAGMAPPPSRDSCRPIKTSTLCQGIGTLLRIMLIVQIVKQ